MKSLLNWIVVLTAIFLIFTSGCVNNQSPISLETQSPSNTTHTTPLPTESLATTSFAMINPLTSPTPILSPNSNTVIDGVNKINENANNSGLLNESEQVRIASSFPEKFMHYNLEISPEPPMIKGGVILFKNRYGTNIRKNIADYDNLERFIPEKLRARKSDSNFTIFLYSDKSCQYIFYGSDEKGTYSYLPVWENSQGDRYSGSKCFVTIMGFYWPENKVAGRWELFIEPSKTEYEYNIVNGELSGDEMLTDWLNNSSSEQ